MKHYVQASYSIIVAQSNLMQFISIYAYKQLHDTHVLLEYYTTPPKMDGTDCGQNITALQNQPKLAPSHVKKLCTNVPQFALLRMIIVACLPSQKAKGF